jgi:alpha-glucosidase (family GH31 glycosyl hydrolase)
VTVFARLDTIPLFVRAGAVVPRGDILRSNNNWTKAWAPYLRIEFFPYDNTSNTFDYYTGSHLRPISCSMSGDGLVEIQFDNLGYDGTLQVYCRRYATVTSNDVLLSEGTDFTYDLGRMLLTIPFKSATTVEITGVTSIFDVE